MLPRAQKLWWMVPAWGQNVGQIPHETQFLLLRMSQPLVDPTRRDDLLCSETFVLILTIVSGPYRSSIRTNEQDHLIVSVESCDKDVPVNRPVDILYLSTGNDPFKLLGEGFAAVSDRIRTFKVRSEKILPPSLDLFGWCTWDAFYSKVTGAGIEQGLQALRDGGVQPRVLIIDDGWQVHTYILVKNDCTEADFAKEMLHLFDRSCIIMIRSLSTSSRALNIEGGWHVRQKCVICSTYACMRSTGQNPSNNGAACLGMKRILLCCFETKLAAILP